MSLQLQFNSKSELKPLRVQVMCRRIARCPRIILTFKGGDRIHLNLIKIINYTVLVRVLIYCYACCNFSF